MGSEMCIRDSIYALGGITYQSWRYSDITFEAGDTPKEVVYNRFGVATGGGVEVLATK